MWLEKQTEGVLDRLVRRPELIDRMIDQDEAEMTERAEQDRDEAFGELAVLDAATEAQREHLDVAIATAREAETASLADYKRARFDALEARRARGRLGAIVAAKRSKLLAKIRDCVPEAITDFLKWIDDELERIPSAPAIRQTGKPLWDPRFEETNWQDNGQAILRRTRALVDARKAANELIDLDVSETELSQRLDDIRAAIPAIEFGELSPYKPIDDEVWPPMRGGGEPGRFSIPEVLLRFTSRKR